jgi:hypothetical protein
VSNSDIYAGATAGNEAGPGRYRRAAGLLRLLVAAVTKAPGAAINRGEPSQSAAVDEPEFDLGTWQGQIAAKRAGALPDRFYQQSSEDLERGLRERREQQWKDRGRFRSRARRCHYVPRVGLAHQTRRGDGPWSTRDVVDDQMIEQERQRSPSWPESERLAAAALEGLRRAERHAREARPRGVRTSLSLSRSRGPRGGARSRPGTRRSSCRPRAPSDDPGSEPGPGDPPPLGAQPRQVAVAARCRVDDEPITAEQLASIIHGDRPREVASC